MANYDDEIAELEKLINAAATEVQVDGTRAKYDLEAARKRLSELRTLQGSEQARPRVARLNLGNCW